MFVVGTIPAAFDDSPPSGPVQTRAADKEGGDEDQALRAFFFRGTQIKNTPVRDRRVGMEWRRLLFENAFCFPFSYPYFFGSQGLPPPVPRTRGGFRPDRPLPPGGGGGFKRSLVGLDSPGTQMPQRMTWHVYKTGHSPYHSLCVVDQTRGKPFGALPPRRRTLPGRCTPAEFPLVFVGTPLGVCFALVHLRVAPWPVCRNLAPANEAGEREEPFP